uniref:Ig-like domain-containing protein n=1 Tax=Mastacembelus armatus TaxID=205130 RepID=A0A3Q3RIX1_9TELE
MDWLHILVVLLGKCFNLNILDVTVVQTSGSVSEVRVRPGDNITLYCDCKQSLGVYVVWFRNCSHGNQPTLVMQTHTKSETRDTNYDLMPFPRYKFLNNSSHTYDLLILNVTDSDEGFYYCGTEQTKVVDDKYITQKYFYNYGNITTKLICGKYWLCLCDCHSRYNECNNL